MRGPHGPEGAYPGEDAFDVRDAYPMMDAVAREAGWDDPEMDSYNVFARETKKRNAPDASMRPGSSTGGMTMWENGTTPTTQIGYVNRNNQRCGGHRGVVGTDHGALAYRMECLNPACRHEYGANGTDVFQRKCPRCQAGEPGIPY